MPRPPISGQPLSKLANLGVLTKIMATVAVAAVVAASLGILGLIGLSNTAHSGAALYKQNIPSIEADARIDDAVNENRIAVDEPDISKEDIANHAQDGALAQAASDFKSAVANYLASHPVAPVSLIDRVQSEFANYTNLFKTQVRPCRRPITSSGSTTSTTPSSARSTTR